MTTPTTIPFEKDSVLKYIDKCIDYWRNQMSLIQSERDSDIFTNQCACYVDAYQSMRTSLFGSLKPLNPGDGGK